MSTLPFELIGLISEYRSSNGADHPILALLARDKLKERQLLTTVNLRVYANLVCRYLIKHNREAWLYWFLHRYSYLIDWSKCQPNNDLERLPIPIMAARVANLSTFKLIIGFSGVDIRDNNHHSTILMHLAELGRLEHIKALKLTTVEINKTNKCDITSLTYASKNGHLEVVKLLLEAGANVHAENDHALRWVSDFAHLEVIKLLLEAGANIDALDDDALHVAIGNGHLKVVKLLLEAGADVHANDESLFCASI